MKELTTEQMQNEKRKALALFEIAILKPKNSRSRRMDMSVIENRIGKEQLTKLLAYSMLSA